MERIENLDKEKVLEIIRRLDFFQGFKLNELKKIISFHTNFFVYQKGEYLIKESSTDTSFYILLSGSVSVYKQDCNLPLARIQAGDFFGEISFLTDSERTTDVVADEVIIVIKVDKNMLNELNIEIRERIKDKIIARLIKRLDAMNKAFVSLIY